VALSSLLLALALAACGSGDSGGDPGSAENPPDFAPAIAKAPPQLQRLYDKGGVVAPGGLDGFEAQLAEVEGYPVVVNNWASWCGPCRTEWPWFQAAAAEHLDEVAFMGVNTDDTDDAAATFLSNYPVPYPSFADPDKELANAVGTTFVGGLPNTLFFDAAGELAYAHQGVYADQAALDADIAKYALSS
jgi:thiol-disulfide isomerase/thioredoxin